MAAAKPKAVASSASAIPGATTARLVVREREIPIKAFMIPQTVPNNPTKGAVAPTEASRPVPPASCREKAISSRRSCSSARSLMPAFLSGPPGSLRCSSSATAANNVPAGALCRLGLSEAARDSTRRRSVF